MLRLADQDPVALTDKAVRKTVGKQVERGGRARSKDYTTILAGVNESLDSGAPLLIEVGRLGAQAVDRPVDVGVGVPVYRIVEFENLPGFLRSSGIVEIDETFAVHTPFQYRKGLPYVISIQNHISCEVNKNT